MERLQERLLVMGWNDSWRVILSFDGTNPEEFFSTEIERLQGSHCVL